MVTFLIFPSSLISLSLSFPSIVFLFASQIIFLPSPLHHFLIFLHHTFPSRPSLVFISTFHLFSSTLCLPFASLVVFLSSPFRLLPIFLHLLPALHIPNGIPVCRTSPPFPLFFALLHIRFISPNFSRSVMTSPPISLYSSTPHLSPSPSIPHLSSPT